MTSGSSGQVLLPYGDQQNDGAVQLSFTLPLSHSAHALSCAESLVLHWGFAQADIVHSKPISDDFTFFVVFARTTVGIDTSKVDVREAEESLTFDEINDRLLTKYGRPLTVVAAATGSDAHTVGLASILTMKGRSGDHGLEKYSALRVVNLGSQVSTEELVEAVQAQHADVVLISQVITQRGVDKKLFMNARLALEAAGLRDTILLVGGGPGVSMRDASLLGFDGMFGRGTTPSEVAAFLTSRLLAK